MVDVPGWRVVERSPDGDRVVVKYRDAGVAQLPGRLPPGVGIEAAAGQVTITAAPGTRLRSSVREGRYVVDVAGTPQAAVLPVRAQGGPSRVRSLPQHPAAEPPPPASSAVPLPNVATAPVEPVRRDPLVEAKPAAERDARALPAAPAPVNEMATQRTDEAIAPGSSSPPPSTPATPGPATPVPMTPPPPLALHNAIFQAGADVGVASFGRAGWGVLVLDRALPLVPPSGWADAAVTRGVTWTMVQVPLPRGFGCGPSA